MMIKPQKIEDFLNTGFRSFSAYDCVISIPNIMDGFKVSQRKALYTVQKHNKKSTVERYSSDIASFTCFHHGAANMEGVLVGLAQDHPGSNNVNFITPVGQFGNILNPAAASGRYISVEPNANFRKWFKREDDIVLEYEFEDGEQIEPKYFVPLAPTILFNGTSGIGTGYACKILAYNPKDVVRNVQQVLDGKKQSTLTPWYKGFKGGISKVGNQTTFTGTFERVNTTTLKITALPIGYDLDAYKEVLGKLIEADVIKDYDDNSTTDGWNILVHCARAFTVLDDEAIIQKLKLTSRESENLTVWTEDGKIKVFETPEELIGHFVGVRLAKYEARRLKLIDEVKVDIDWASMKIRFINFYLKNTKLFKDTGKAELIKLLVDHKFDQYDRLLAMQIWSLTRDRIAELEKELDELKARLKSLQATTAKAMYAAELLEVKNG